MHHGSARIRSGRLTAVMRSEGGGLLFSPAGEKSKTCSLAQCAGGLSDCHKKSERPVPPHPASDGMRASWQGGKETRIAHCVSLQISIFHSEIILFHPRMFRRGRFDKLNSTVFSLGVRHPKNVRSLEISQRHHKARALIYPVHRLLSRCSPQTCRCRYAVDEAFWRALPRDGVHVLYSRHNVRGLPFHHAWCATT